MMRNVLIGLLLLFGSTLQAQECYTDPFTGRRFCPLKAAVQRVAPDWVLPTQVVQQEVPSVIYEQAPVQQYVSYVTPTWELPVVKETPALYHWSHPRTIEAHLRLDHGISTVGMNREEMYKAHDSLHMFGTLQSNYNRQVTVYRMQPVRNLLRRIFQR